MVRRNALLERAVVEYVVPQRIVRQVITAALNVIRAAIADVDGLMICAMSQMMRQPSRWKMW